MNNVTDNSRNIRKIKLRQYQTAEGQIYNLGEKEQDLRESKGGGALSVPAEAYPWNRCYSEQKPTPP